MGLIEEIKSVAKLVQEAGKLELYEKLLKAQEEALVLLQENRELKEEIKKLKEALTNQEQLLFENNMYWLNKHDGKEGPFCSRCWDINHKLVRKHNWSDGDGYKCPACNTYIEIKHRPPQRIQPLYY
jgi:DNA-directed RNA polymerase subunit RPC12/RpoP